MALDGRSPEELLPAVRHAGSLPSGRHAKNSCCPPARCP